jgi:hypothetical protein
LLHLTPSAANGAVLASPENEGATVTPDFYREKAAEFLQQAATVNAPWVANLLRLAAADYLKLAEEAEPSELPSKNSTNGRCTQ